MFVMKSATSLRIARPTDHLADVVRFYRDGVDLTEIGSFHDHEGFDGVMLGAPGWTWHLEFTRCRSHPALPMPTSDDLVVLYVPQRAEWEALSESMLAAGFRAVSSFNPYWDARGRTFEDFDRYRVVLQRDVWFPEIQPLVCR